MLCLVRFADKSFSSLLIYFKLGAMQGQMRLTHLSVDFLRFSKFSLLAFFFLPSIYSAFGTQIVKMLPTRNKQVKLLYSKTIEYQDVSLV